MWRVKTDSNRHQSGGPVVGVITPDYEYDLWYWCNIRKKPSPNLRGESCESAMASNTYGSARTHEEVLRMIEDTPDKIARKLAEHDENNRAITDRWMGHTGGYYAITPADKNVLTDQTNQIGKLMNLAELKQKLKQER